jgi:Fic family protein
MQLNEVVLPAARLYVKVLSIHPFLDGNGRTAYALLQYALVRSRLICVALEDFSAHQRALGVALRDDSRQSYLPLRDLLVDKLVKAKPQDEP